jgi:hypothetical protein
MKIKFIKSGVIISISIALSACVVTPVQPVAYRMAPVYVHPAPVVLYTAPVYVRPRYYPPVYVRPIL